MRLKRLLLRYYPPGIIVEYQRKSGLVETRSIDLFDLHPGTVVEDVVEKLLLVEKLCAGQGPILKRLVYKLIDKNFSIQKGKFELLRAQSVHILPLTNVAFCKDGSRFLTGSYDGTAKLWDTFTGIATDSYQAHTGVVYSMAFNHPLCNKVLTGSFDKTAILWDIETGKIEHKFSGHSAEILCLAFALDSNTCATGSMDFTAKIFSTRSGVCLATLIGHEAEIVSIAFNGSQQIATGSFDTTARIWDTESGNCLFTLLGHTGELCATMFTFDASLCITASNDGTCKLWNSTTGECMSTLTGHSDEILDIAINASGSLVATASADQTARMCSTRTGMCLGVLCGHTGEITQISFSSNGALILTASTDKTCRLWSTTSFESLQILEGCFDDEILAAIFSYEADLILTATKDNYIQIFRKSATSVRSSRSDSADGIYRFRSSSEFASEFS